MLRLIVSGCNGYMGRAVTAIVNNEPDIRIVAGIDIDNSQLTEFPVYVSAADILSSGEPWVHAVDALIDFSSPAALDSLLEYCVSEKVPVILCTTGYSDEQIARIEKTAQIIPVFRSGNMSVGINLIADLIKRSCSVLGEDFDVEIVERHHRRKLDAPSGTALMLADAAKSALPYDAQYIYERESVRRPRNPHEIGISAVRGGTIVGVHEVIFAGTDEVIEIKHTAGSRDVFAAGAIRAAKWIKGKAPGLYNMADVL